MKIRDALLAESLPLPPIPPGLAYQYVVAGNGLFIRAEDSRMEAMAPVALADVHSLEIVEPYARLKVPRVPAKWLWAIQASARKHLPNEAMYQFLWQGTKWHCAMPQIIASHAALEFDDRAEAVIDLHSHGTLSAFFSPTDDGDEKGLRFYVTVGHVDRSVIALATVEEGTPEIACRVGIYGHIMSVPVETIFDGAGPFTQVDPDAEMLAQDIEHVLAEEDTHE